MTMDKQLYDTDFCLWIDHNVSLLRQGNLQDIDVENIAEELDSMSRSDKRELLSRLTVLIMHLLKWEYQVDKRSKSWTSTIKVQRLGIKKLIKNSPSLKYNIEAVVIEAYDDAKYLFEDETEIDKNTLPITCPYTFEELMNT